MLYVDKTYWVMVRSNKHTSQYRTWWPIHSFPYLIQGDADVAAEEALKKHNEVCIFVGNQLNLN